MSARSAQLAALATALLFAGCGINKSRLATERLVVSFFFSSRRRHTISTRDWSSDVCSSDLAQHKFLQRSVSRAPEGICVALRRVRGLPPALHVSGKCAKWEARRSSAQLAMD